ncbi:hypothetical protein DP090_024105 [Pseudomonas sp. MDMC216]|nr:MULTISPECIES: hypothetical protein [Pseudomonas]MBA4682473.1 hypothetical protein [Pseudomonas sp.]MDH1560320.1 hypothetical protein [Pseudomonas chengduensis]MDI5996104.1 hypothetical protein [Pseudomonas sp. MDMC216]MDI6007661.1 hypothetical protein [Pseudomonas sp. MDMC17]
MKPENSLIASIKGSKNSIDLIDKLGEAAIDSLIDSGVLRDIPIIGTAISIYKAGNEISAHIFAKKIACFLSEVEKTSTQERLDFFASLPEAEGEDSVGETLILILEKLDSYTLAKMLGKAFRLLAEGKLSKQTYEIYVHAIKQLNPYLISQIKQLYAHESISAIDSLAAVALSNSGIVKIAILSTIDKNTQEIITSPQKTAFGRSFYENIVQ